MIKRVAIRVTRKTSERLKIRVSFWRGFIISLYTRESDIIMI